MAALILLRLIRMLIVTILEILRHRLIYMHISFSHVLHTLGKFIEEIMRIKIKRARAHSARNFCKASLGRDFSPRARELFSPIFPE